MILQEEEYGFLSLCRLVCLEVWGLVGKVMGGGVGGVGSFGGMRVLSGGILV